MPKPMLHRPQVQTQTQADILISTTSHSQKNQQAQQTNKMMLDRLLRKPRSKRYMDAMRHLDAGGHTHNHHQVEEIINAIREEFPEVEMSGILLGIVSRCYLGEPYEVHTLDMSGCIIEHYVKGRALPGGMERARTLALRGGYEFVEVYIDCVRAVSSNGTVSVIPN